MTSQGGDPNPDEDGGDGLQGFVHANGFDSSQFSDRIGYDGFDQDERYHFAPRFLLAESWRIAAEVVSRHPELRISRIEDDDQNTLLVLHKGATGWRAQFDLVGGIGYLRDGDFRRYSWLTVFAQDDPLAVIKRLQVASGLRIIPARRGETGHSSAYQTIASVVGLHMSSTATWQAIPVRLFDIEEGVNPDAAVLNAFPTARHAADDYVDVAVHQFESNNDNVTYWHEPLWFLYEGFDARAIVDEAGLVHLPGGAPPIDIRAVYATCGRSWWLTAARIHEMIDHSATGASHRQSPQGGV
tara:strand:+ start:689 stop:1585 length:897 start_codon:yes stop_codon:yes gene_type:complete